MDRIKDIFDYLVKDYGLTYEYQEFTNCYDGNWTMHTHSFYNGSGCFTIQYLLQRDELSFYYSPYFSCDYNVLCENAIDICSIEKGIWDKHIKGKFFKSPFFWWRKKKILVALSDVIRTHVQENGEFFGIVCKKQSGDGSSVSDESNN